MEGAEVGLRRKPGDRCVVVAICPAAAGARRYRAISHRSSLPPSRVAESRAGAVARRARDLRTGAARRRAVTGFARDAALVGELACPRSSGREIAVPPTKPSNAMTRVTAVDLGRRPRGRTTVDHLSCDETGRSNDSRRWAVAGSNRRPPACKAGALPAELTARVLWFIACQCGIRAGFLQSARGRVPAGTPADEQDYDHGADAHQQPDHEHPQAGPDRPAQLDPGIGLTSTPRAPLAFIRQRSSDRTPHPR